MVTNTTDDKAEREIEEAQLSTLRSIVNRQAESMSKMQAKLDRQRIMLKCYEDQIKKGASYRTRKQNRLLGKYCRALRVALDKASELIAPTIWYTFVMEHPEIEEVLMWHPEEDEKH